jgi:cell fate (sporulation/competence/biofilm development) regulator YmcA (YheA/YmcA/DUF963 family)
MLTKKIATTYRHVQSTASTIWSLGHNLDMHPIIEAYVTEGGQLLKVIPQRITYVDPNNAELEFSYPITGFATVV